MVLTELRAVMEREWWRESVFSLNLKQYNTIDIGVAEIIFVRILGLVVQGCDELTMKMDGLILENLEITFSESCPKIRMTKQTKSEIRLSFLFYATFMNYLRYFQCAGIYRHTLLIYSYLDLHVTVSSFDHFLFCTCTFVISFLEGSRCRDQSETHFNPVYLIFQ